MGGAGSTQPPSRAGEGAIAQLCRGVEGMAGSSEPLLLLHQRCVGAARFGFLASVATAVFIVTILLSVGCSGFLFFFLVFLFFYFFSPRLFQTKGSTCPCGQWESASPGVQGESRAPGAFTSFPFLPLPSSGELERPCRVGRNQSYLLPSLLAAAATDATEEKPQRFFLPNGRGVLGTRPPLSGGSFFRAGMGFLPG